MDVPCVPHMFVQRIDALPEGLLEEVLSTVAPQTDERPGFLQSIGWGKGSSSGASHQTSDKAALRSILQQRRREELAADADTVDYSSEPYDSITRQVQLQWRVYARLYPEEVAEKEKLSSMLSPSGGDGLPLAQGQAQQQAGGGGGGASTLFGVLPSVMALQQTVRTLVPVASTSATSLPPASASAREAAGPASTSAAFAGRKAGAGTAASAAAPGGASSQAVGGFAAPLTCTTTKNNGNLAFWRQPDPIVFKLSRSLEQWYDLHREQTRPLRRGRKARLLVVRGVDLPAEWKGSMRPAAATSAGDSAVGTRRGWWGAGGALRRACVAAVGAAAGAVGLRHRPRVWEVGGAPTEAEASGRYTHQTAQEQAGQRRGERAVSRVRRGLSAADGGGGLVAAQAAARGMSFVLRRTTIIPPEWL